MSKKQKTSSYTKHRSISLSLLVASLGLLLNNRVQNALCEAKEFDWNELGLSIPSSRISSLATYGGNNASSNLRILVQPQRRMTKNYEVDYGNSSQASGETTYVLPGSSSSSGAYQTSVGQPGSAHSSAYSALSASLASLKNRLNARGVSLSADPSSGYGSGSSSGSPSYTSTLLGDSGSQQQHSGQSQPTYLSVGQHEQPSAYSTGSGQGNENKTIVLAIPAKINFLADGRSSSGSSSPSMQQKQQPMALSIQQSANGEQQSRAAEYSTKQLSLVQEASIDPNSQLSGVPQDSEHHLQQQQQQQQPQQQQQQPQYVIVNQSPSSYVAEQQYVATNLGGSVISQAPPSSAYPSIYSTTTVNGVKYIQAYSQPQPQQQQQQPQSAAIPVAIHQPATIQKLYTGGPATVEQAPQEPAQLVPASPVADQTHLVSSGRYCLDTCNPADARWRKYSYNRYKTCCSRSSQYDPSTQYDFPSVDKVSETSAKYADDAYYNYLYRRSRTRRSRRNRQNYGSGRYNTRYSSSSSAAPAAAIEDDAPPAGETDTSGRQSASRSHAYDGGSYSKYYRAQRHHAAPLDGQDEPQLGASKYSAAKERGGYRRGRARDLDAVEPTGVSAHESGPVEDDHPSAAYQAEQVGKAAPSYGSGEFSVTDAGRYQGSGPMSGEEDDRSAAAIGEEPLEPEASPARGMEGHDYTAEPASEGSYEDAADQPETTTHKYSAGGRRRKFNSKGRPRKSGSKETGKYRKSRKNKYNPKQDSHPSSQPINGTDYDSAQPGAEHYHHSDHSSHSNGNEDDQSSYSPSKDSSSSSSSSSSLTSDHSESSDKESSYNNNSNNSNKYKASLNESTVANLSKTTMHLKEILSLLEKKAYSKSNETSTGQQQPVTSTPAPTTTTYNSLYSASLFGSQYAGSLPGSIPSEYLTADLSMKSPYRLETSSLSSALSSPSLSLSPSAYSSLSAPDHYSPLSSYAASHYGLPQAKHIPLPTGHQQRKRRPSKNVRPYNNFMLSKPYGLSASSAALLQAAGKSPLSLSSSYYPALQYNPNWYPRLSPAGTNPYPYRSLANKNPYSSLLNGPLTSKLAAAAASQHLYSDESRLHGLSSYDPLSNVASSLRPSAAMRLKNKPFIFQPQVLPIYTRHSILAPTDVKKR